ncbi:hypothetical protein CEE39_04810 [bacterium (candidate division B38) B3_B38]|nr:MAG: hypothetical protein CEE39_04810 [bacterium (candidate division B38) B3_B38]
MTRRKHLPLIRIALIIASLTLIQFFSCAQDKALIDFSQGFIGVSGNGPDQSLLYNKENNLILNHCIEGATLPELRKLKLPQIEQRLEELSKGKLIIKEGDIYRLAFSVIRGSDRVFLSKAAKQTAENMLPTMRHIVQELKEELKGEEESLYHITWSVVMDSAMFTWLKLLLDGHVNPLILISQGYSFCVFPDNTFQAGTNFYEWEENMMAVSHSQGAMEHINRLMGPYGSEIIKNAVTQAPLEPELKDALISYGLIDSQGRLRVLTYEKGSLRYNLFKQLGERYASEIERAIDAEALSKRLKLTTDQSFVIAFHEASWEILKLLHQEKILLRPPILVEQKDRLDQSYKLVSILKGESFATMMMQFQDLFLKRK